MFTNTNLKYINLKLASLLNLEHIPSRDGLMQELIKSPSCHILIQSSWNFILLWKVTSILWLWRKIPSISSRYPSRWRLQSIRCFYEQCCVSRDRWAEISHLGRSLRLPNFSIRISYLAYRFVCRSKEIGVCKKIAINFSTRRVYIIGMAVCMIYGYRAYLPLAQNFA